MTPQLDSSELLTKSQCSLSELSGVCTTLAPLLSRSSLLILTINNVNSHKQMSALTFHNKKDSERADKITPHPTSHLCATISTSTSLSKRIQCTCLLLYSNTPDAKTFEY